MDVRPRRFNVLTVDVGIVRSCVGDGRRENEAFDGFRNQLNFSLDGLKLDNSHLRLREK